MNENIVTTAELQDEPKTEMGELKMDEVVRTRIQELDAEIEDYRIRILAAQGALDSAEKELNEVLSQLHD